MLANSTANLTATWIWKGWLRKWFSKNHYFESPRSELSDLWSLCLSALVSTFFEAGAEFVSQNLSSLLPCLKLSNSRRAALEPAPRKKILRFGLNRQELHFWFGGRGGLNRLRFLHFPNLELNSTSKFTSRTALSKIIKFLKFEKFYKAEFTPECEWNAACENEAIIQCRFTEARQTSSIWMCNECSANSQM